MLTRELRIWWQYLVNFLGGREAQKFESTEGVTDEELAHLARGAQWLQKGMAYAMMHSTRPSTIGLVLSSSPLALLAW